MSALRELVGVVDRYEKKLSECQQQLTECQAREAELREALRGIVEITCVEHQDGCATIIAADVPAAVKQALALPQDDKALKEFIKQAKREVLLETAELVEDYYERKAILRMAEELK